LCEGLRNQILSGTGTPRFFIGAPGCRPGKVNQREEHLTDLLLVDGEHFSISLNQRFQVIGEDRGREF